MAQISRRMLSAKAEQFTESVIREMTRLALKHGAVNLSQGFPDFAAPEEIKEARVKPSLTTSISTPSPGARSRCAMPSSKKFERTQGVRYDPEREVTICCGSTEAMMSAMMAIINPGDEIVVFEPFYENYGPDAILSGATPRFVKLRTPDWSFDEKELAAAFGPHTKAIILNTPNIRRAKFSRARSWNSSATSACDGTPTASPTKSTSTPVRRRGHISMARIEGMPRPHHRHQWPVEDVQRHRLACGLGAGSAGAYAAIRKVHDFLTVGAAARSSKLAPALFTFLRATTTSLHVVCGQA